MVRCAGLRMLARVSLALLLAAPLLSSTLASTWAARESALHIGVFYTTTSQAYDNWAKTNYAAPPKVASFPTGTVKVAAYFSYSGAAKSDNAYLVLRKHNGPSLDVLYFSSLATGANQASMARFVPSPALVSGSYDIDLLVNDSLYSTITISIGGAGLPPTGGNSPGPVGGVTVSKFYAITPAAASAWIKQTGFYPLPQPHPTFASGTTAVSFVTVFKGAVAKVTKHEIFVYGPNGLKLNDGGPYTFGFAAGGITDRVDAPSGLALPDGSYTANLTIAGQTAATTTFTVG